MTPEEYSALDAMNWSTLKTLAVSPKLFAHRRENPQPDKPALALGRALHCAILEPERWRREYAAIPDFGDLRTKAAKELRAEWLAAMADPIRGASGGSRIAISGDMHALAERCAEAVLTHRVARELLTGGRCEEVLQWTDETGIVCKARVDYITPGALPDLKSTRDPAPFAFARDVSRYLYHGQLAYYYDGARAAGRLPPDAPRPYIVAVQSSEPHDVAVYQLSQATLDAGRSLYRRLLRLYEQCRAADYWPGCAPDLLELELPPWAVEADAPNTVEEW